MKEFKYHWLYIPIGATGINSQCCASKLDFLIKLDEYNHDMNGVWQCWSV